MDNFLITETEMKLKVQLCVVEADDFNKKDNIFEKKDEEIYQKFLIPFQKSGEAEQEHV